MQRLLTLLIILVSPPFAQSEEEEEVLPGFEMLPDRLLVETFDHWRVWDGRDQAGFTVPPGVYLYQVEVEADASTSRRQGVVSVAY